MAGRTIFQHFPDEVNSPVLLSMYHNKINRTCEDGPTGHCTRREKERQTEKEMGRQRNGMDRFKVE